MQQHAITVGSNRLGQIDQFGIGPAAAGRKRNKGALVTNDFVVDVNAANERNWHFVSTYFSYLRCFCNKAGRRASCRKSELEQKLRVLIVALHDCPC
jgi:hypothetical protein